jgi:hypothetical protein
MRRAAVALALALALGSCADGSRGDLANRSPTPDGFAVGTAPGEQSRLQGSAQARARGGVGAGGTAGATAGSSVEPNPFVPSPGPARHNTMPLRVTLNRHCARAGDQMAATAQTLEGAALGFAAAYSNNDIAPDFTYVSGEANPTGTFTWTWVIRPTIPAGSAFLSVVAEKAPKGASWDEPFRIANEC